MSRRALILEALQLAPLWVRRELLPTAADTQEESAPDTAEADTPNLEPQARHPLPAIARAANRAIAPMVTPSHTARAGQAVASALPERQPESAPVSTTENPREQHIAAMDWDALQQAIRDCTACALCRSRQQAVPGIGNIDADLVVVGEAPGEEEDRLGEPFVGRAGKLLDGMLASIGEKRGERVYIANVLKCRPPGNRNPQPDEIALCRPFLARQLALISPKAILAAGRFAAHTLLQTDAPLSALRNKVHTRHGIPVVVTYHPAYLLRNLPDKAKAWEDLLRLKDTLHATDTE